MSTPPVHRQRTLYSALAGLFRVLVITVLATLLAFCVALFLGIIGILLAKVIRGAPAMDIRLSYRYIAVPVALVMFVIAFGWRLVSEIRYTRRIRPGEETSAPRRAA